MTNPEEERPIAPDVPPEEGIDPVDMADRLDLDPDEQRNYTEDHPENPDEEQAQPEPPDE